MDGNQGRDMARAAAGRTNEERLSLIVAAARSLLDAPPPEDHAGLIEQMWQLEELVRAIDGLQDRIKVALVLNQSTAPGAELRDGLVRAINVIPRRDT